MNPLTDLPKIDTLPDLLAFQSTVWGGVALFKVSEILKWTDGSCDFGDEPDFEEIISVKSSDSGFHLLVESFLDNGWQEDSAVGYEAMSEVAGYITEGHHRLTLAILLGLDYVPVSQGGSGRRLLSAHHKGWGEPTPYLV